MTPKSKLDEIEFMDNPEPRCACVLLLDTSGSMNGAPIAALNEGLKTLKTSLMADPLASKRVEVAVVAFDSDVRIVQDFVTVDQFVPPTLTSQGTTHMGAAIHQAMDLIQRRKEQYKSNGIDHYRPWVFMITDGAPQGEPASAIDQAADKIKQGEEHKRVIFFAVGVEGADMAKLAQISVRTPVKLIGLNFGEMFLWLSKSMSAVSSSRPEDGQVALPPPGWGTT